jgi:hypothetical protein
MLPMFQRITLEITKRNFSAGEDNVQGLNPKKQTLSFVKQFARSYHLEKKLPPALNGMILN